MGEGRKNMHIFNWFARADLAGGGDLGNVLNLRPLAGDEADDGQLPVACEGAPPAIAVSEDAQTRTHEDARRGAVQFEEEEEEKGWQMDGRRDEGEGGELTVVVGRCPHLREQARGVSYNGTP